MAHEQLNSPTGQELIRAISKLRTNEEIGDFLSDFFSPTEVRNLINRWQALRKLASKSNYLEIQKETGLSSATIAKMSTAHKYGSGIFTKILSRIS